MCCRYDFDDQKEIRRLQAELKESVAVRDGKIETLEAEIRRLNEEAMKTFELTKSQASPFALAHKERWGG